MANFRLFYGEQLYGDYDSFQQMKEEVDGAALVDGYIFDRLEGKWRQWHVPGTISVEDVPPVIRTMVLLME